MAGRHKQTSQDPDVEASQAELAALENRKSKTQEELLALFDEKKKFVADFEDLKKKTIEEMAAKRAVNAKSIDDMEQKHRNIEMALTTIESVQKMTIEESVKLEAHRDALKKEVGELTETRVKEEKELKRLGEEHSTVKDTIKTTHNELKDLHFKLEPKKTELKEIEAKVAAHTKEYADLSGSVAGYQEDVSKLIELKTKLAKEVDGYNREIGDKQSGLAKAESDLSEIEKKAADHKVYIDKATIDINNRLEAAGRLEQLVDGKRDHLKQLEALFSTERLAKYGYKKVT